MLHNFFISYLFSQGSNFGDRLSIFLYAYPEDMDSAWPLVLDTIATPKEISSPSDLAVINFSDISFIRCSALMHIKINGADTNELLTYAEKLDARLKTYVCPQR